MKRFKTLHAGLGVGKTTLVLDTTLVLTFVALAQSGDGFDLSGVPPMTVVRRNIASTRRSS